MKEVQSAHIENWSSEISSKGPHDNFWRKNDVHKSTSNQNTDS